MGRETEIVLQVAEIVMARKRNGKLKKGVYQLVADPEWAAAPMYEIKTALRDEIDYLGGWIDVLAAAEPRAQRAWKRAQHALTRPRDLGDVVDDAEHVRHGAAQRAPGQPIPLAIMFDSLDPESIELSALAIERWTDPGAARWSRRLRRYAGELRAGGLYRPTEAELVERCVSGEHDIVTLRRLLELTLTGARALFIGYRARPLYGFH